MPFTQELPEWKATGTKPPQSKLDTGWQIGERPPSGWWNWLLNSTYLAIQELQNESINVDQKGVANGVATLNASGKVPASQLDVVNPPDASTTTKGIVMLEDSTTSASVAKAATPNSVKTVNDSLNAHTGNANIHVTAGDKTNWNLKETTSGAQAKADAAQAAANTYTNNQTSLLIPLSQKGAASGVATLGTDGKIPMSQLSISAPSDASTTVKGIVMLEDSVTSVSTSKAATPNSVKTAYDLAAAAVPTGQKGAANGVATLGTDGKVPATQLPTLASTANDITIADANDYYSSTKVEGALQEIGQTLAGTRASIVTTAQQLGVM